MFTTYFIQPLYNVFVFLIGIVPHGDVGVAIILLTVLIRIILYPVFSSSIRTQMGMQAMQAELDLATEKYKNKPEELAKARMELLRKHKVNPLAGIFALIVQVILIIALSYAFFREGFPKINDALLYSFVHAPAAVNTMFLGFVNLVTPHHIVLALMAGGTQFLAIRFTIGRTSAAQTKLTAEKAAALRMQNTMMLYMMPALLCVLTYLFSGALGIYFVTGNLLSLGQEWLIRRELRARHEQP